MSYLLKTNANQWLFKDAFNEYLQAYENEEEAVKNLRKDLQLHAANINSLKITRSKARYLLSHFQNIYDDVVQKTSLPIVPTNQLNQTINLNMKGQSSNTINNYTQQSSRKRDANVLDDPFTTHGNENTSFFNKCVNLDDTKEDNSDSEEEDTENEVEDQEERHLVEENVGLSDDLDTNDMSVYRIIKNWQSTAPYQKVIHKQDLLYYNILDFTDNTTSCIAQLLGQHLVNVEEMHIPVLIAASVATCIDENHAQDLSLCRSFDALKSYYKTNKNNVPYIIKKVISTYLNQKTDKINFFSYLNQKESDYKHHFIAPLYKALFKHQSSILKEWGEIAVSKTRVDGLLSVLDEDGTVCLLSVVEVSGPPHITDRNHFMKDKIKTAKNLKVILNEIYKMNPKAGGNIKKVKVYGVQVYKKTFYVYSLQLSLSKLYFFKEEIKFTYPTSPSVFPSQLVDFMENLSKLKSLIENSSDNIQQFINLRPSNQSEQYIIDSANNSPEKKR